MTHKPEVKTGLFYLMGLILLFLLPSACMHTGKQDSLLDQLIEVDREFSRASAEKGANKAFLAYIDDQCVLLRPNRQPIIGREKIQEMFSRPDTSFVLTWEPLHADVSKTGDLGYTYGIYRVKMDSPEGNEVIKEGTYVSIWKKDDQGNWKFVLDTGNQGLGTASE